MSRIEWEPLEHMGAVRRFVANYTVFIAAGIGLIALAWGIGRQAPPAAVPLPTIAANCSEALARHETSSYEMALNDAQRIRFAMGERDEDERLLGDAESERLMEETATRVRGDLAAATATLEDCLRAVGRRP